MTVLTNDSELSDEVIPNGFDESEYVVKRLAEANVGGRSVYNWVKGHPEVGVEFHIHLWTRGREGQTEDFCTVYQRLGVPRVDYAGFPRLVTPLQRRVGQYQQPTMLVDVGEFSQEGECLLPARVWLYSLNECPIINMAEPPALYIPHEGRGSITDGELKARGFAFWESGRYVVCQRKDHMVKSGTGVLDNVASNEAQVGRRFLHDVEVKDMLNLISVTIMPNCIRFTTKKVVDRELKAYQMVVCATKFLSGTR